MYMAQMSGLWDLYGRLGGTPLSMMVAFERIYREMAPIVKAAEYQREWNNMFSGAKRPPPVRMSDE